MNIVDRIIELEKLCFADPWQSVIIAEQSVYVVEDYGYALGVLLGGEVELLRIGVLPECRGQGRGFALMSAFLEKSRAKCDGVVYLEVASKNAHAVKLYEKCGFTETRRRRGYYNDGDDAIIMEYRPALSEHDNRD